VQWGLREFLKHFDMSRVEKWKDGSLQMESFNQGKSSLFFGA